MRANRFRFQFLLAMAVTCASAWIAGSSPALAEQSFVSLQTATALFTHVSIDLDDIPLKEAVESLAAQADVQVIWDEQALADMGLPGDETVAYHTNRKLLLRTALWFVLQPVNLAFEDQGDSILITSNEVYFQRVVKTSYEVRTIVSDQFTKDDLIELLSSKVAEGTWQANHPDQEGYLSIEDGILQVTHRREVQQAVDYRLECWRFHPPAE